MLQHFTYQGDDQAGALQFEIERCLGNRDALSIDGWHDFKGEKVNIPNATGLTLCGEGVENSKLLNLRLVLGNENTENHNQPASNSVYLGRLSLEGALECYSLQRDSRLDMMRIIPKAVQGSTLGLKTVFCNTLSTYGVRVDNGGNDMDGWEIISCPNMKIIGGSVNYSRKGMFVTKNHPNANKTTSLNIIGLHLEGNRETYFDGDAIGSANIKLHAVASKHWNTDFPMVSIGGEGRADSVTIRNAFINGIRKPGTLLLVGKSKTCNIAESRLANASFGIKIDPNAAGFDIDEKSVILENITNN